MSEDLEDMNRRIIDLEDQLDLIDNRLRKTQERISALEEELKEK